MQVGTLGPPDRLPTRPRPLPWVHLAPDGGAGTDAVLAAGATGATSAVAGAARDRA